jgi:hypothetical protein
LGGKAASIQCRGNECWSYISTPPHVFMAWCLIKHRDFIFALNFRLVRWPENEQETYPILCRI